jgi:hypothetical protein
VKSVPKQKKRKAYDKERNFQMDAADPRIDYLSGTDGPRGYELYGLLSLNLKKTTLAYQRVRVAL